MDAGNVNEWIDSVLASTVTGNNKWRRWHSAHHVPIAQVQQTSQLMKMVIAVLVARLLSVERALENGFELARIGCQPCEGNPSDGSNNNCHCHDHLDQRP